MGYSTVRLFDCSEEAVSVQHSAVRGGTFSLLDYSTVWLFGCWPSLSRTWRISRFEHSAVPPARPSASTAV